MWRAKIKDAEALSLAGGVVSVRDHILTTPAHELSPAQLAHLKASSAWVYIDTETPARPIPPAEPAPSEPEQAPAPELETETETPKPKRRRGRPRKTEG
jgi:hypothetical protein